ncbi:factor 3 subunit G [Seminavis robusta]|uniref:Eukaryotic translation initiation factor 3 subunit G n=1 Tax=Seminavis robusta TaxID=568900 RepID=A0A9N8H2C6_9STRA|nr:factor 3 subunit G [Seminavis robusta]|eukprot:Sro16_g011980.1 factor 3 subunit G (345) ;mRNA; f:181359-182393
MSAPRWGDDLDDSDDEEPAVVVSPVKSTSGDVTTTGVVVPPTHKSRIDAKGVQIVTSYRPHPANPNQLWKTVTKLKVATERRREAKSITERRQWKKFGDACQDGDGKDGNAQRSTIQSKDEVFLEDPNADNDLQEEDATKAIAGNLNAFWAKQQRRQLERKYDVTGVAAEGGGAATGWTQVGAGGAAAAGGPAAGAPGKYIPPAARAGLSGAPGGGPSAFKPERRDDLNTIRVTNISENTTEADLQDLFQRFGRISRVYLAKDKETLISRGFAFVSFVNKDDAARAMEKLQGYGYDHLILKLEWARPNTPKDPASSGTEYRSGYGKALAQDTKAKVSYASNLTK